MPPLDFVQKPQRLEELWDKMLREPDWVAFRAGVGHLISDLEAIISPDGLELAVGDGAAGPITDAGGKEDDQAEGLAHSDATADGLKAGPNVTDSGENPERMAGWGQGLPPLWEDRFDLFLDSIRARWAIVFGRAKAFRCGFWS